MPKLRTTGQSAAKPDPNEADYDRCSVGAEFYSAPEL